MPLTGYPQSLNLRTVIGLDEYDIQLIFKHNNSIFLTYETSLGIYLTKDNSDVVYTLGDHEATLQIEHDDISMKTKLILARFGGVFGTLGKNEESFFNTLLEFT